MVIIRKNMLEGFLFDRVHFLCITIVCIFLSLRDFFVSVYSIDVSLMLLCVVLQEYFILTLHEQ